MTQRSDPNGLLIRFDVGSLLAIVQIDMDLEGDGEPAISVTFPIGVGFDGRYVRALAFKPTVNGTWPLLFTATNRFGESLTVRCTPGVQVTF